MFTAALLVASMFFTPSPYVSHAAACAAQNPGTVHRMGKTPVMWQYVSALEARQLRISRCSVNIGGTDDSVVMTPVGKVVATG
jgi:hypothetical protein